MIHEFRRHDYASVTYRTADPLRLQIALNDVGLYSDIVLTPAPLSYPESANAIICDQIFVNPQGQILNPDGRWIGFEYLVSGDQGYTFSMTLDNMPVEYVIPALPIPDVPIFSVQSVQRFTIGNTNGRILDCHLQGIYSAGGVPLDSTIGEGIVAISVYCPKLSQVHKSGTNWFLRMFNADGIEIQNGAILDLTLSLVVLGRYR